MAELVPVEFWEWCIKEVKQKYPKVQFIAEVYNPAEYSSYMYRGGFDYLYDKVGLYDTLKFISQGHKSSSEITGCWQSINDKQNRMLNFLENHDEQRFASDFFGKDARNTYAPLYVSLFLNSAPFMVYFGEEVGERGMEEEGFSGRDGRTTIFDWWSVTSIRRLRKIIASGEYKSLSTSRLVKAGLKKEEAEVFVRFAQALRFAASDEAITMGTTYDLCYCNYSSEGFDKNRHFAFLRDHGDHTLLIAANFSMKEAKMKLTIPEHAFEWMGIKSDASLYPGMTIEMTIAPMDGAIIQLV
jgi:glycosidase